MNNLKERVTIYQVAAAAGVSLATVSRVINNSSNVTPETKKKVENAIMNLGYKPSGLAQALATNRSTNIGIIIPSANYVYISNMLSGINEAANAKGYVISLFTTSHSREAALKTIDKVIVSHVDGAIVFDDELNEEDISKITSYSVPAVVINNSLIGEKIASVLFNYDSLLKQVVIDHYASSDAKPMTFIHVPEGGRLLSRCEQAFVETHVQLGKAYEILTSDDSYSHTYNDFKKYFMQHKTGFFVCYRDSVAAAIMNAATDLGIKVPEEVEVLSLVGTKYAKIVRPTLTAMHIDMEEVGRRSMYMLSELLNGELKQKTFKLEAALIKRSSTK